MSDDFFELVREHVSIFDVMEECAPDSFAAVRSREVGHKIPCPMAATRHPRGSDPNPSAKFFPETKSLYCWSCSTSWDAISLYAEAKEMFRVDDSGRPVMGLRGPELEYGRAAAELARKRGIEFKVPDWYKRLKKSIADLSSGQRGVIPEAQWAQLCSYYITRVSTWAYGDEEMRRADVSAAHRYALDCIPEGGQVGAERDLHQWYGATQDLLRWRAGRRQRALTYRPGALTYEA